MDESAAPLMAPGGDAPYAGLAIVAAVASNRVIGHAGMLPWRLDSDLRRFRALTLGHTVVMGRKTFEGLGKPLPRRRNIVLTRSGSVSSSSVITAGSLASALLIARSSELVFVMGGHEPYAEAARIAERLYITEIHERFFGDVLFPEINQHAWIEASREDGLSENGLRFSFVTYERRPIRPAH